MDGIATRSTVVQQGINSAIQSKIITFLQTGQLHHKVYDSIIFGFMRRVLGGRVRMFVSGGAPLQPNIKQIIQVIFSAPVFECYGMTELAGCLTSTCRWERKGGH